MEPIQLLEIGQDALWVLIKISTPVMLVALIIGLVISLFQALTQIQEMTLTFVPKIVAMLLFLLLFMPFIGNEMFTLTERINEHIIGVEKTLP
ncbi:MAG: flagellar biosynthesis protein FliQ [Rickettsiales bacterium]|nr:flagellar biosynthesis protein FliQ [Rickettsiales bacterium]